MSSHSKYLVPPQLVLCFLISTYTFAQDHNYLNDDLVVIQAENPDSFSYPWKLDTATDNFRGPGYIQAVFGTNPLVIDQTKELGLMSYTFQIEEAGIYEIRGRNYIPFDNATENNDIFLRIDGEADVHGNHENELEKAATNGFIMVDGEWDWDNSYGPQKWNIHFQYEGPTIIQYEFDVAEYTMTIAARSPYFILDEFLIFKTDTWDHWDIQEGNFEVNDSLHLEVADTTGTGTPPETEEEEEEEEKEEEEKEEEVLNIDNGTGQLMLYPNPSIDEVFIKTSQPGTLYISSLSGKLNQIIHNFSGKYPVDITHLAQGTYLVKLNEHFVGKLVKL